MKDKKMKKGAITQWQSWGSDPSPTKDDNLYNNPYYDDSGELCSLGSPAHNQEDSGWGKWGSIEGIDEEFDFGPSGSSSGHHSPQIPGVNQIESIGQDVLNLIFEHFDLQPGSKTAAQTRKDLLSAAKTCKAFVEPALNSLWRVLPSLLPLLLLFPSAEVFNGQYFFDNIPLTKWERFEMYSRRVRTLYMEPSRVAISPSVYLLIRDIYGSSLLPGLKSIHIPDDNAIDFPAVMLLALGASLDEVELNNSAISQRNFYTPFLTLLASKSPQLRHLILRGQGNVSLDPLYRFTSIQRLEIKFSSTYLYPQTLRRLGGLVELQDLTLDTGADTPAHAIDTRRATTTTHSPSSSFGKLRRLHIIGIPSSIPRILDDINLTNLITLVIDETPDIAERQTESFWINCFRQLSVCSMIENIEINQLNYRSWGYEHYSLSTCWFRPLMDLTNVKSLVINGSALSGSDEDFRTIALGFRKLRKLVVPPAYYSQGRTLACLSYFSQHCPDLYELKICIGSDIVKNLEAIKNLPKFPQADWQRSPTTNNLLEKLYIHSQFGQLRISHMVQVAQFLDLLFPNLSTLEAYDSNMMEAFNWTGIQEVRVALQATRMHTLRRVKSEMSTASAESNS